MNFVLTKTTVVGVQHHSWGNGKLWWSATNTSSI